MGDAKSIDQYRVGDEMFRHVRGGGTFRYVVQGIRQYEGEVQLEVECQTCSHGWKCRLLLARDDRNRIHFVHMLNEDEDDRQDYWHTNDGLYFWPTLREAREEGLRLLLREADKDVRTAKESLERAEKRRADLAAAIEEQTP